MSSKLRQKQEQFQPERDLHNRIYILQKHRIQIVIYLTASLQIMT